MTATYAVNNGVHYRYYISTPLLHGKSDMAGTVSRVPASDVEDTMVKALQERLKIKESDDDRTLLQTHVERVEIQPNRLVVTLKPEATKPPLTAKNAREKSAATIIHIPWNKPPTKRGRGIVLPAGVARDEIRPISNVLRKLHNASAASGKWLRRFRSRSSYQTSLKLRSKAAFRVA